MTLEYPNSQSINISEICDIRKYKVLLLCLNEKIDYKCSLSWPIPSHHVINSLKVLLMYKNVLISEY